MTHQSRTSLEKGHPETRVAGGDRTDTFSRTHAWILKHPLLVRTGLGEFFEPGPRERRARLCCQRSDDFVENTDKSSVAAKESDNETGEDVSEIERGSEMLESLDRSR